jgi:hypothetical protein
MKLRLFGRELEITAGDWVLVFAIVGTLALILAATWVVLDVGH